MKITRNNYEAFFLDYHEGSLSDGLRKEVLAFVDANPDLREEFESFEVISLPAKPAAIFPGKEKLKRNTVTEYNYKTWFVAYVENDLDAEGEKEVSQFIERNPRYGQELETLKLAKILPDLSVRFENKSSLKKGGLVIPLWVRVAAAACIVIGLLGYWLVQEKPARDFVIEHKQENKSLPPPADKKGVEELKTVAEEGSLTIEKKKTPQKIGKPAMKKAPEIPSRENLASMDSALEGDRQLAIQSGADSSTIKAPEPQTLIVINETKNTGAQPSAKLVVLDDNDLAELGLKQKQEPVSNSILADAVNGVGKIFGVNAHYDKEHNPLQDKYRETLALGPLAITRTVSR